MSTSAVRAGQAFVEVGLKSKIKEGVRQIQNQLSAISGSMKSFGTGLAAAGATATAAFGVVTAGIVGLATRFAGAGSEIDDISQRTGIAASSLSALAYAAKLSGTEIGAVEKAVSKMQKLLVDAAKGGKASADALAQLGLKSSDFKGLGVEQQFALIAQAIAKIEDPTMRNALAMGVLGKSATEVVPMMRSDIGALIAEATRLGAVMSEGDVAAAAALGDALDRSSGALGGFMNTIGAAIAGPLTSVLDIMASVTGAITQFISENRVLVQIVGAVAVAGTALGAALLTVGGVVLAVGTSIGGLMAVWPAIAAGIAAVGTAAAPVLVVLAAIAGAVVYVTALGGAFAYLANRAGILAPAFAATTRVLTLLSSAVGQTLGGIASAIGDGNITKAAQVLWAGIKVAFFTGAKAAYDAFVWLFNNAGNLLSKFGNAIAQTFADIFGQIPRLIKAALTGGESITAIIAETLKGNLGPMLEGQIQQAQAELNKLTASPANATKSRTSSGPGAAAAVGEEASAEDESKKAYDERVKALREEITQMKLGADAAELLKLQQQGLNQAQIAAIQQMQQQRNAMTAHKKSQEDAQRKAEEAKKKAEDDRKELIDRGKAMAEEVRTPFEVLQAKMAEIARLESGGFIDRRTAALQRGQAMGDFNQPMRDAIKSGRNNVAEFNSQSALDIVLRNQRTFGMGTTGANKKNPVEEYARQQRDYLRIIAENAAKNQNGITVNVKRI